MIVRLIGRASWFLMMGMILGFFGVMIGAMLSLLLCGEHCLSDWQIHLTECTQELLSLLLHEMQYGFPGCGLLSHGISYSLSVLSQAITSVKTGWFATQAPLQAWIPYMTVFGMGLQWIVLCLGWFLLSLPLWIMGVVMATVDGVVGRLRRRYQGGRESAHRHQHAVQMMQVSLVLGMLVFMVWPFFFMCSFWHLLWVIVVVGGICLQRSISSYKKYQ